MHQNRQMDPFWQRTMSLVRSSVTWSLRWKPSQQPGLLFHLVMGRLTGHIRHWELWLYPVVPVAMCAISTLMKWLSAQEWFVIVSCGKRCGDLSEDSDWEAHLRSVGFHELWTYAFPLVDFSALPENVPALHANQSPVENVETPTKIFISHCFPVLVLQKQEGLGSIVSRIAAPTAECRKRCTLW